MMLENVLHDLAEQVKNLPGDVVEIGVYKGDSALQIAKVFPGCTIHLFDTFSGMPNITCKLDKHRAGDFDGTSLQLVQDKMNGHAVQYYVGVFPASAKDCTAGPFKLAHVDVDLYHSTKDALVWLWDRMTIGGVIVDDDYASWKCAGARVAVDEFCESVGVTCETFNRVAWIFKT